MYIVDNPQALSGFLINPVPGEIYGLVPMEFKLLINNIEELLAPYTDVILYGDLEIVANGYSILKFNPSFDPSIIIKEFPLDSPIFIKTSRPLYLQGNNLNEITRNLLRNTIGIHIAEPIFQWNPNYQQDQANAINIR